MKFRIICTCICCYRYKSIGGGQSTTALITSQHPLTRSKGCVVFPRLNLSRRRSKDAFRELQRVLGNFLVDRTLPLLRIYEQSRPSIAFL